MRVLRFIGLAAALGGTIWGISRIQIGRTDNDRFIDAIVAGKTREVSRLLARGCSANGDLTGNGIGRPALLPLELAARHDQVEVLGILLDRGADPDATNAWGDSALQSAAILGNAKSIRYLLKRGASVNDCTNCVTGQGSMVLWRVLTSSNLSAPQVKQIVRLLLDHGANPNTQPQGGGHVMQMAGIAQDQGVVKLLIAAGGKKRPISTGSTDSE